MDLDDQEYEATRKMNGLIKESEADKNKECEDIREILMKIGISANLQGFIYILEAIEILERQKIHTNISTIYEFISKKYDTTIYQAERAIRQAADRAYKRSNILKGIYEHKPENVAFIYDLVYNIDIFKKYCK